MATDLAMRSKPFTPRACSIEISRRRTPSARRMAGSYSWISGLEAKARAPSYRGDTRIPGAEVLAGARPTVASEMYALGALLFHLATGVFQWRAPTSHR